MPSTCSNFSPRSFMGSRGETRSIVLNIFPAAATAVVNAWALGATLPSANAPIIIESMIVRTSANVILPATKYLEPCQKESP